MHDEYIRIVPGSGTAILFVHGIIGTPDHFRELIALLPEDISVMNILLDGHGGSIRDFAGSSMAKWEAQVEKAISALEKTHRRVLLVGHSMGTLLLLDAVKDHPKVPGLFLLAAPLMPGPKPAAAVNALKVIFGKVKAGDGLAESTRDSCSIRLERNLLKYLSWIPRYLELFRKAAKIRRNIAGLDRPCRVLQSRRDELVSARSCRHLRKSPLVEMDILPDSFHFYYSRQDKEFLLKAFREWYVSHSAQI